MDSGSGYLASDLQDTNAFNLQQLNIFLVPRYWPNVYLFETKKSKHNILSSKSYHLPFKFHSSDCIFSSINTTEFSQKHFNTRWYHALGLSLHGEGAFFFQLQETWGVGLAFKETPRAITPYGFSGVKGKGKAERRFLLLIWWLLFGSFARGQPPIRATLMSYGGGRSGSHLLG